MIQRLKSIFKDQRKRDERSKVDFKLKEFKYQRQNLKIKDRVLGSQHNEEKWDLNGNLNHLHPPALFSSFHRIHH